MIHVGVVFKQRLYHLGDTVLKLLVVPFSIGLLADLKTSFVRFDVEHIVQKFKAQSSIDDLVIHVLLTESAEVIDEGWLLAQVEDKCWVDCLVGWIWHLEAGDPVLELLFPLAMMIIGFKTSWHHRGHLFQL